MYSSLKKQHIKEYIVIIIIIRVDRQLIFNAPSTAKAISG